MNDSIISIHINTPTGGKPCIKLTRHTGIHISEKPYQCQYCDNIFSNDGNLLIHIRTHTGDKPYQSATCDLSLVNKIDLLKHRRTHTGEKPFQCCC